MSYDLILKSSKRNWSREPLAPETVILSPEEQVKNQTTKLALIKSSAEKGDKKAVKQWTKINKKVTAIQKKAAKGNPKAKASLAKLQQTGLFGKPKTALAGEFVGKDEILGRDEILGYDEILGAFVGEEEAALASEGGSCERNALRRRFGK
jgi:hypothetical protein